MFSFTLHHSYSTTEGWCDQAEQPVCETSCKALRVVAGVACSPTSVSSTLRYSLRSKTRLAACCEVPTSNKAKINIELLAVEAKKKEGLPVVRTLCLYAESDRRPSLQQALLPACILR